MAKMVENLWDVDNRERISINSDMVSSTKEVKSSGLFSKAHTEITFQNGTKIRVEGSVKEINEKLKG